jgi:hypothetical protein
MWANRGTARWQDKVQSSRSIHVFVYWAARMIVFDARMPRKSAASRLRGDGGLTLSCVAHENRWKIPPRDFARAMPSAVRVDEAAEIGAEPAEDHAQHSRCSWVGSGQPSGSIDEPTSVWNQRKINRHMVVSPLVGRDL